MLPRAQYQHVVKWYARVGKRLYWQCNVYTRPCSTYKELTSSSSTGVETLRAWSVTPQPKSQSFPHPAMVTISPTAGSLVARAMVSTSRVISRAWGRWITATSPLKVKELQSGCSVWSWAVTICWETSKEDWSWAPAVTWRLLAPSVQWAAVRMVFSPKISVINY